jgi:hypothetical protein
VFSNVIKTCVGGDSYPDMYIYKENGVSKVKVGKYIFCQIHTFCSFACTNSRVNFLYVFSKNVNVAKIRYTRISKNSIILLFCICFFPENSIYRNGQQYSGTSVHEFNSFLVADRHWAKVTQQNTLFRRYYQLVANRFCRFVCSLLDISFVIRDFI